MKTKSRLVIAKDSEEDVMGSLLNGTGSPLAVMKIFGAGSAGCTACECTNGHWVMCALKWLMLRCVDFISDTLSEK